MGRIKYKVIIFLTATVTICLAGVVLYSLLLPVPLSVSREIEAEIEGRGYAVQWMRPIHQGLIEQLLPYNPKTYSFEILEVIQLDLEGDNPNLPLSNSVTKAICITVRIQYTAQGEVVFQNRPNPETNHYLASKQDGDWSVQNLDDRPGAIGCL